MPGRLGRSSAGWQRVVRGIGQGIVNKLTSFSANEGVSLKKGTRWGAVTGLLPGDMGGIKMGLEMAGEP